MATILVIDDNDTIREGLALIISGMGHRVVQASSGEAGITAFRKQGPIDFVISDLRMAGCDGVEVVRQIAALDSDVPAMIITAFGSVETAVEAMKLGAFDFLTKPFAAEVVSLKVARALELVQTRRAARRLQAHNDYLEASQERTRFADMIGGSPSMQSLYRAVQKVAGIDSSVFISGESGTGKELVAKAVHDLSTRAGGPFVKVNCGAITETLLESELFGHEKGAFTGAIKTKLGRFELADGGTLFLDEVGDIPPAMQVKLLRALQEREFERVGGEQSIKVNVRVVSATHRDLEAMVKAGSFREDLYYRLHVIPLHLPALRERREDIPLLAQHFVKKWGPRTNAKVIGFAEDAVARLLTHTWPGNVRELESAVEQALVFCEGEYIDSSCLPPALRGDSGSLKVPAEMALPDILDDLERQLILRAYKQAQGVKTETARLLGIKTSALYYKLEKYGIE